jgi:hypothetical protein
VRAQLNLINLSAAYKACFCDKETGELTKAAERVLRDLGHYGHLYKSVLKVSPATRTTDPMATGAAEGRRDIVRRIWGYIRLDPYQHPIMQRTNDDE